MKTENLTYATVTYKVVLPPLSKKDKERLEELKPEMIRRLRAASDLMLVEALYGKT